MSYKFVHVAPQIPGVTRVKLLVGNARLVLSRGLHSALGCRVHSEDYEGFVPPEIRG